MIPHIAEASEGRGSVVFPVDLAARSPSPAAIEAAVRVARAFGSEIESLFIADEALISLAGLPFAREISLSGRARTPLTPATMVRRFDTAGAALKREVDAAAHRADVRVRYQAIRGDGLDALAAACAGSGPWNVVALSQPLGTHPSRELATLFTTADTTGVLVTGPQACVSAGPVAIILDDIERLPSKLRAAERLSGDVPDIRILLAGPNSDQTHWMETQARLLIRANPCVRLDTHDRARAGSAILDWLRRTKSGFLIVQFGGTLIPAEEDRPPLLASVECPVLVVR